MTAFLPACEAAGITKLVARIVPENRATMALCARHGCRVVGTNERHAMLDGAWRDVVIVERLFDPKLRSSRPEVAPACRARVSRRYAAGNPAWICAAAADSSAGDIDSSGKASNAVTRTESAA